jgi:hypothetical protein
MVNRKQEQGDESIRKIKEEHPEAKIEWMGCDLGNLKEVKEVFGKFAEKEDRLDLVSDRTTRFRCGVVAWIHCSTATQTDVVLASPLFPLAPGRVLSFASSSAARE